MICDIINKYYFKYLKGNLYMERRCTKCGSFLTDNDRFCPGCGENAPQEIASAPAYTAPPQQQYGNYNPPPVAPPPYVQNNAPQYNPYPQQEEEMTVGKWILTLFVTNLGFIGLIFLFIWGFGDGPKARQNYCKAMLIWTAIGIALVVLFYVFIFAIVGISISEFADEYSSYSSMAANFISSFIK